MIAAGVGRVGNVAAAAQLQTVGLFLRRVVHPAASASGGEHGKTAGSHVIRRQLHRGGEVVVMQKPSSRQTAQGCSQDLVI